jgi:predicted nucleotide-binding protein
MGDTSGYAVAGVQQVITILQAAKLEVELDAEAAATITDMVSTPEQGRGQLVFTVHGHDAARKHEVARVVRELPGEEPVILHEQPDVGQVLIESSRPTPPAPASP